MAKGNPGIGIGNGKVELSAGTTKKVGKERQPLTHRQKTVLWVVLMVVAVAGLSGGVYAWFNRSTAETVTTAGSLQIATARQGDLILQTSGAGYLVAADEKQVGFETSGTIASLYVALGDTVEKGQLLAELDDTTQQESLLAAQRALRELTSPQAVANAELAITDAQLEVINAQYYLNNQEYWQNDALVKYYYSKYVVAKENLDKAQTNYDDTQVGDYINNSNEAEAYQRLYGAQQSNDSAWNMYSLYAQKPTQRQYNAARAALDLAKAQLTNAENYLAAIQGVEYPADATGSAMNAFWKAQQTVADAQAALDATRLYAPISGMLMTLTAGEGDKVSGSFITIQDLDPATIEFYLDASDWGNVRTGYEVSVTFDALPSKAFTGKVTQVMPGLITSQGSSMVQGTASLESTIEEIGLPVGVDAGVDVISGQALNAVLVPVEALHALPDGTYSVFVMKNGIPVVAAVVVGLQNDTFAVITSGLSVGDVVTTGIVETSQ